MTKLDWLGTLAACTLLTWTASGAAKEDRCRVRVGHPLPVGCAPFSKGAVLPKSARAKQSPMPPAPDADLERAHRPPPNESSKRRSERLLIQELSATERLLRQTPKGAPERILIIRRLAEGYVELERLAQIRRIRAELEREREARKAPQR